MSLPQGAPKLNRHWLHASGGLIWHLRALRYRNSLWQPFRQTVQAWLESWQPPTDKLLIVGTSLQVYPAAGLLYERRAHIETVLVDPNEVALEQEPGTTIEVMRASATQGLPVLVRRWLA